MCGRARLATDYSEIKRRIKFGAHRAAPNLRASWNIAPTQDMLCAVLEDGERSPVKMHWGLIPSWAQDPKMTYPTFNAKAETASEKPSFRGAWRAGRRCLVIVDGFYEWRKPDKAPFTIQVPDDLTVLAGLWETRTEAGAEPLTSCTVITTAANAQMRALHDRMPVILDEKDWPAWLGETTASEDSLHALLAPYAGSLQIWPVDKRVGNVRNNDAALIARPEDLPLYGIDMDNQLRATGKSVRASTLRKN